MPLLRGHQTDGGRLDRPAKSFAAAGKPLEPASTRAERRNSLGRRHLRRRHHRSQAMGKQPFTAAVHRCPTVCDPPVRKPTVQRDIGAS